MKKALKFLLPGMVFLIIIVSLLNFTGYSYLFKAAYYNFPGIDDYKIFSNTKIGKSSSPEPWPVSSSYNKIKLSDSFYAKMKHLESVAFVVIKNDSLIHEEYWDNYSDSSFSNSFSIAKTYVSVLTGIALKEGKIKSLEQPVGDFIKEFSNDDRKHITIRHLLTMSSGLSWEESYINPFSVTTEGYYGGNLRKTCLGLTSIEKPGEKFEYRSGDTQILAMVLKEATGKRLAQYFEEKLWQPTGAEKDALWSLDAENGIEKAYCCLNTNAKDFARLGMLYLKKGNWNGKQLVDTSYVEQSLVPTGMIEKQSGNGVDFYGYSWWIIPDYKGEKIFYARGILGQYVIVVPSKNIVAVRLGKSRGEKVNNHYEDVYLILDEISSKF